MLLLSNLSTTVLIFLWFAPQWFLFPLQYLRQKPDTPDVKIAAERQSGKILADVIWTSEVPDFYKMKKEGILANYKSPVFKEIVNPFDDYDGSFHAARLGTLGIIINTDKVKTAPTQWADLKKPEFKNGFAVANPALSGPTYVDETNCCQWSFTPFLLH